MENILGHDAMRIYFYLRIQLGLPDPLAAVEPARAVDLPRARHWRPVQE